MLDLAPVQSCAQPFESESTLAFDKAHNGLAVVLAYNGVSLPVTYAAATHGVRAYNMQSCSLGSRSKTNKNKSPGIAQSFLSRTSSNRLCMYSIQPVTTFPTAVSSA